MSNSSNNRSGLWLHYLAISTAIVTLPLIFIGGLVTSHDVAMAVPDWPTTYGYNMFLFPWKKWVGGIFYEHSHRLFGSLLGFLAIIQTVWLFIYEKQRRWLRIIGFLSLALIVFQGNVGGYRVLLNMKPLAILHACLAQIIFCMLAAIALFTSCWWKEQSGFIEKTNDPSLRKWTALTTIFIFIQLVLGATMRHTESGIAVPDFPLIYGKLFPSFDANAMEWINDQRRWRWGLDPVTVPQILIHLSHRLWAMAVTVSILMTFQTIWRKHRDSKSLIFPIRILIFLFMIQIGLGAFVIWTNKAADIATAHVAMGALMLVTSFLLTLISFKLTLPASKSSRVPLPATERITT